MELPEIYKIAIEASMKASEIVMQYFGNQSFETEIKEDNSPVTDADISSSELITSILRGTNIPILSEEGIEVAYQERKKWNKLWIVDPLDGTKEFIKGTHEFTINIGLVENGAPIFGVIAHPPSKKVYFGNKEMGSWMFNYQSGSYENAIKLPLKETPDEELIVTGGKNTGTEFYEDSDLIEKEFDEVFFKKISSALKFCKIAEGIADIYPRNYPCMEWDTAAGHAIVHGVGKDLYEIESGKVMEYNKENLYVPNFLLT